MLTIPVIYDDATREISVSEEWGGTVIDDRSTMFSVSGIPDDVVSAKLDVKVAVRSTKGKTIRPFLILKGIESGTGTAVVPSELFLACKRDLKFIFQLELMTEFETYASKNWITLKVSPAIVSRASGMDPWNQDQVLIDAYEPEEGGRIIFRRFSGDEFSVILEDNEVEWANIKNVPWRSEWSEDEPSDKEILVESFLHGEFDKKTDMDAAIPEWVEDYTYTVNSTVICQGKLYQSLQANNKDHNPTTDEEWWKLVSSSGSGGNKDASSYITTIGDGTTKTFTVTHSMGTEFYCVNLIDAVTGHNTKADVRTIDDMSVEITFTTAPAVDGVKVIIIPGSASRSSVLFVQTTPSNLWTIHHNLARRVMVQVWDENGKEIGAEIEQTSKNTVEVRFSPATALLTGFVTVC